MCKKQHIAICDMINDGVYIINARNSDVGLYKASSGNFLISRYCSITSDNYLFEELHYDHPDKGTAKPIKLIAQQKHSDSDKTLNYLNKIAHWQEAQIKRTLKGSESDNDY